MNINIEERNIIKRTSNLISEIKIIFYEILNLYCLQQFYYKENFSIYNKILQLNEDEIETNPEKLFFELTSSLNSLNLILKELNSNSLAKSYCEENNNDSQEIISIKEIKFCYDINKLLKNYKMENKYYHNLFSFENNIYWKLKEKESLTEKYFKKLKINYSLKHKKKSSKEYIQIKIAVHNIFVILIKFPSNLPSFYENDFEKNISLEINGLFDPNNINREENTNCSNIHLFKKLSLVLNSKFKQIIRDMKELYYSDNKVKISFYECFVQFLDYIYDFDKIFKIKCGKCLKKIKYISFNKFFSVPLLKIQEIDENYKKNLINDIEKGNDINNINKIYNFFHEECINNKI